MYLTTPAHGDLPIYPTVDDYDAGVLKPALGEFYDQHDIGAIMNEVLEWNPGIMDMSKPDERNASYEGYVERDISLAEFWEIVRKHAH